VYAVEVRDHIMIAHSFKEPSSVPPSFARGDLRGGCSFIADTLDENGNCRRHRARA